MRNSHYLPFVRSGHQFCRALAASAVLLATGAGATWATTYVMTTDRELVDRSQLVVLANVLSASPTLDTTRPSTDYLIEIERIAKGYVPSSTLLVRTLGGLRSDGLAMRVFGQPNLLEGDRVVLFLNQGEGGGYELSELGLSIFFTTSLNGDEFAFRALGVGTNLAARTADPYAAERSRAASPRRLEAFLDWVRDYSTAPSQAPTPDFYVAQPPGVASAQSAFTLTRSGGGCGATAGNPARWFEFDQATNVRYFAANGGQTGVPGGGLGDIDAAFNAWNRVNGTSISLRYAGTTSNLSAAISLPLDGRNLVLFEDPFGEVNSSFNGSGTVAVGTIFFFCSVQGFPGGTAHAILESGIVFQDGTGANFFGISLDPAGALREVLTHEVGHTIGIGHSCGDGSSPGCSGVLDDAIMRAFVHDDGRGARLNSDDRAAATFLYAAAAPGGTPTPPASLTAAAMSTSEITVAWADSSSNETGFEVEERSAGGEFATIATVEANTTAVVIENLPPATLRQYRVRAINGQGASDYSPIAGATTNGEVGPCVVDDQTLCLNQNRFEVTSLFETNTGASGSGQRGVITDDTGYFWFFNDTNVEIVVKVLDGCGINSHYWVFAGGLTDVQAVLTVVDKQTGVANTYFNPQNTPFQPIQDTSAFATCP